MKTLLFKEIKVNLISGNLLPDMPVTQDDEFLAGQPFQSYRAASMELIGGDTDFRSEAILEPVREAGGGIHHDGTGIHFAQEAACVAVILGNDGIRVLGAVNRDVLDGLIETA